MKNKRKTLLTGIWYFSVLFVGLVIGLISFFPRSYLVQKGLQTLKANTQKELYWGSIQDSGFRSVEIHDLRTELKNQPLRIPKLKVQLGYSPLLQMDIDTGPLLEVQYFKSGLIRTRGAAQIGELAPQSGSKGELNLELSLTWKDRSGLPQHGDLLAGSDKLLLPGRIQVKNLRLDAYLENRQLTLRNFQAEIPMPVNAAGNVELDYSDILNSKYNVQGSIQLANTSKDLQRKGRLKELFKR
jgi:hypothetical protein